MPETVWRTTRLGRVGSLLPAAALVIFVVVVFGTWTSTPTADSFILLGIFLGALAVALLAAWAFGFRPYIALSPSDRAVRLCQPFGRVQVLPLADIVDVRPARSGLLIALRDGRVKSAWAVQTSIMDRRTHPVGTRADRVAEALRAAMARESVVAGDAPLT